MPQAQVAMVPQAQVNYGQMTVQTQIPVQQAALLQASNQTQLSAQQMAALQTLLAGQKSGPAAKPCCRSVGDAPGAAQRVPEEAERIAATARGDARSGCRRRRRNAASSPWRE